MPQTGDILLVKGKGWIAHEIEEITHSPYGHAALFINSTTLIEANGFRRVGKQDPRLYAGIADIFEPLGLTTLQRRAVVSNALKHEGEVYDYPLLIIEWLRFAVGITIPWHEFHCKICSTLIADAFRDEGHDPLPDIINPAPGDLPKSPLFRYGGAYV